MVASVVNTTAGMGPALKAAANYTGDPANRVRSVVKHWASSPQGWLRGLLTRFQSATCFCQLLWSSQAAMLGVLLIILCRGRLT
jgi:hypothetical protein